MPGPRFAGNLTVGTLLLRFGSRAAPEPVTASPYRQMFGEEWRRDRHHSATYFRMSRSSMLADFFRTNTYLSLLASRFQRYMHSPFGVSEIASTCRACCRDRRATRFAHMRLGSEIRFGAALPTRIFVKGGASEIRLFSCFHCHALDCTAGGCGAGRSSAEQSGDCIADETRRRHSAG